MKPLVSFIVSAYDRPAHLACLLYSLKIQTIEEFEVIVTDNAPLQLIADQQRALIVTQMDERFQYERPRLRDCYETANWGAARAKGGWLCFPSDDGYYAPRFLDLMFRNSKGSGADVIFCNCVWDGRGYGRGEELIHLNAFPARGGIDKGGFLIRRDLFLSSGGFQEPFGVDRCEDGIFIERIAKQGAKFKKVEITGWIHN